MKTTTRIAATLTAAATTLTLIGALASASPPEASTGPRPLSWGPCEGEDLDPRQECTTVMVPLDHDDPRGDQIGLAVSRLRSDDPASRRGTLVLIPGGPGGSSLDRPSTVDLPSELRAAYDVVGFDPRGVGRSAPVSCEADHGDIALTRLRPWPAVDGSIDANVAWARRLAAACAENGGPVLRSISTATEARDIDHLRQALGETKISAWGVSYGTYVGAVYAQLFPHRTDRVVLDSNDDPDPRRVARGWLANYETGVEDAFPDFAEWATTPGNPLRLADNPEEVRPLFLDLAERLDADPIPWPGANPEELNGNVLRQLLMDVLYSKERFPALATVILAARDGDRLPAPNTPPDEVMQNTAAVVGATICHDVVWPSSPQAYARDVAESRAEFPLTAGMPVNIMPCAFWSQPKEKPVRITPRGPSNILLVQNLRDPSTPHSGAVEMRRALGRKARMVTVDAVGHGSYLANGNTCGDRLVTEFLVDGSRPRRDTFCPAE